MTVRPRERAALVATIATLGAVPVASGVYGMLAGPERAPGGAPTTASVDSEYRFVNVFWAAAGVTIWWSLRRLVPRAAVTRLLLALAAFGGVPRLLSLVRHGRPHPVFVVALVLELVVVPLVMLWHRRVVAAGD